MVGEPCAPGTSGGGKAQTPMHHHLLEVHFGGVALMMDEKDKNVPDMVLNDSYDMTDM